MKTAKEKFREYDFHIIKEWEITVPLTNKKRKGVIYEQDDGGYIQRIIFIPKFKAIRFEEYEQYNDNKPQGQFQIHMEFINIFNQQMKELGWLDD